MNIRHVTGRTRTLGVIGDPVDHSVSPAIHNAAIAALGLDLIYVPLPVARGRFPEAARGLAALGFVGASVTMPHKEAAAEAVDELSEDAERLRAVNTIVIGDRSVGHNTDTTGFERMLRHDAGVDPAGMRAAIVGAGGAARAVALALARAGADTITVLARDPSRGGLLLEAVSGTATHVEVTGLDRAERVRADLVVNASPLGAAGEDVPTPPLGPATVVIDLLYRPATTPLLARARAAGATAAGGLGLLVHQGALAFELWTGRLPPLEVMSGAAVAAIGETG